MEDENCLDECVDEGDYLFQSLVFFSLFRDSHCQLIGFGVKSFEDFERLEEVGEENNVVVVVFF